VGCKSKKNQSESNQPSGYARAALAMQRRQYDDAEKAIKEAIDSDDEAHRDSALVEDRLLYADLARRIGKFDVAESNYENATALTHTLSDKRLEGVTKLDYAGFLYHMGSYKKAISLASESAALAEILPDWNSIYAALEVSRKSEQELGMFREELALIDSMSHVDQTWLGSTHTGESLLNRFELYRAAGEADSMKEAFDVWAQKTGENEDTSIIYGRIIFGESLAEFGQTDGAFHAFSQALDMLNLTPDKHLLARALTDIGNLSLRGGKIDQARRYYADALENANDVDDLALMKMLRLQETGCDWMMYGKRTQDSAAFPKQIDDIRAAIPERGDRIENAFSSFLKGRMADQQNLPAAALRNYLEALDIYERCGKNQSAGVIGAAIAAFMQADHTGWYEAPLQVDCMLEDAGSVFTLAERKNLGHLSRFFLRLAISAGQPDLDKMVAAPQWKSGGRELLSREIGNELSGGPSRDTTRLQKLSAEEAQLSQETASNGSLPLQYQWLLAPKPIQMKDIQDSLPSSSAIVEYITLPRALYLLVIRRDTAFVRKSATDMNLLNREIAEYKHDLAYADSGGIPVENRAQNGSLRTLSSLLGRAFASPLQPLLGGIGKLYVVLPAEEMWTPIHAFDESELNPIPLGAKYTVSYLPSAAELLFPRPSSSSPARVVAGMGFQGRTGWDTEYELKDIHSFIRDASLYFDTSATFERLKTLSCDILHLNTVFSLDAAHPDNSYMVLSDGIVASEGRKVSLGEMFSASMPRTVVFSNISLTPGELDRYAAMAMLAGGAQHVIATMWQGDRKAKKDFGEWFYTAIEGGTPPDEAYHLAIQKLSASTEDGPGKQWAAYYLFGR
jgi:tetratricopeptide (TPR) repeat protein